MSKVIVLITLFYLYTFDSFSQGIVGGFVYNDNDTLGPLGRVKIVLQAKGNRKTTRTNMQGFYSLELPAMSDTINVLFVKKKYISLEVKIVVDSENERRRLDVLLRGLYGVHDKEHKGSSEILLNRVD